MSRASWPLVLLLLAAPQVSQALQLHWSSGADTLTFTEATRCILVLEADSAEVTLPPEWRLLWVGDSTEVSVVALDSLSACASDIAQPFAVEGPATLPDTTAHRVIAHLCSGGNAPARRASFLLDLPAWGRGKLKAVALSSADSSQVLESNVVSFNGGVDELFQPVILTATQSRSASTVTVSAVGAGLATVQRATIVALDSSWTVPLTELQRSPSSLTGAAVVPASLPPASLDAVSGTSTVGTALLPGDTPVSSQSAYSYGSFVSPSPAIWRPKDFTLVYDDLGHFHLFFMRQETSGGDSVQKVIGHASGTDLRHWTDVTYTLATQPTTGTGWDRKYLWAPFLFKNGPTYYLYYTGVDASGNQSIGVTTTADINPTGAIAWDASLRATSRVEQPAWASNPPGLGKQCRDPFVMKSTFTNDFYMLFTTMRETTPGTWIYAIGVARSTDLVNWTHLGRLAVVDLPISGDYALRRKAESPSAFSHINYHNTASPPVPADTSYYLMSTSDHLYPQIVALLWGRQSPWDASADTTTDHWQRRSWLYDDLGLGCPTCLPDAVYNGWEATEYCYCDHHDYVAGINYTPGSDWTAAIWIVMMRWIDGGNGPDQMVLWDPVTEVTDEIQGQGPAGGAVRLMSQNPGKGVTRFEIALRRGGDARLRVFDVQGRCVREIVRSSLRAGLHTAEWDGCDASGIRVGSGIYFARLDWEGGHSLARCVVLR